MYFTSAILNAILPVYLIMGAGLFLRRFKILTPHADSSLMSLSVNVLTPCLIFSAIIGNQALNKPENLFLPPIFGFITISLGCLLGIPLARLAGLKTTQSIHSFAYAMGIYNWGFIPIPLIISIFNKEVTGVLFVFNLGVQIAMWTVALLILTGSYKNFTQSWKLLLNPPISSVVVAILLNLAGASAWMPHIITKTIEMLGACAIPLGLLLVGATFMDCLTKTKFFSDWRFNVITLLGRLCILPLSMLVFAFLPLPDELRNVLIIQAAMPAGVMTVVITRHYGGDDLCATRIAVITSIAGIITIPLWIHFALNFFDMHI
ncbi:MAG: AEC family transporter [Verrucomicrobiota bacterium]